LMIPLAEAYSANGRFYLSMPHDGPKRAGLVRR